MDMPSVDIWIRLSPLLLMIFIGMLIVWADWPEEKSRLKRCRERRKQREQFEKDGATDLALVTMPIWMDDDSSDRSSSSSSDYDGRSSSLSDSSSSYSDFD